LNPSLRHLVFVTVTGIVGTLLLPGCGVVSFEDASTDPRYSHFVGSHYRSEKPVAIHGISMERDYKPVLDHYTVTGIPGIRGPEVLSQKKFESGVTVKVLRVMRCTDCFLDPGGRVEVVVEVTSSDDFTKAPVKMNIKYLEGPERTFTKIEP